MLQISLLVLCLAVFAANAQCPGQWSDIPGSEGFCYIYYNTPATWAEANVVCQSLAGGDLTSIDNQAEGTAIYNYWKSEETDSTNLDLGYWIGLTDIQKQSGRRIWTDWTRLRRTNWQTGQPSANTNDNCAYVGNEGASDDQRKQWRATSCGDVRKPYFCERKLRIA